ncbi:hypothetical protein NEOLEDRAFT_1131163 [Neolentinus lepideus HHB14362 ss-1]|uniref:Uncharacterized protein n=1 Tax=Neolentinus lepideus HHB14362 ss-1 TaxID=1314782 RepID=A0A165TTK9_9AGAM|nr:hypothetical protein NEOLEDRAFT_1131163 [Neolentinus lepideus HHB14362 ss-1]
MFDKFKSSKFNQPHSTVSATVDKIVAYLRDSLNAVITRALSQDTSRDELGALELQQRSV